jgi:hypothetical protein
LNRARIVRLQQVRINFKRLIRTHE